MTTQSPNMLNQSALDKQNKAHVVRINKVPLLIIISLLILVFVIGFYSLEHNRGNPTNTLNSQPDNDVAADSEQSAWVNREANAVPGHGVASAQDNSTNTITSGQPVTSELPNSDSDFRKRRTQALLAAMDSPISAPGVNASQTSIGQPGVGAVPPQPVTTAASVTAANEPELPLNQTQIDKLKKALGGMDRDQNKQTEKEGFLDNLKSSPEKDYLHESLHKPLSPYEIKAGTVIPGVTISGVNSDLPGQFTAQVRQNVYDTVTGKYLLIPQGSRIIMVYDSHVSYGQNRILVAVRRLIFPNGNSIDLQGMQAGDSSGYSGFHDQVDNHYFKIFGSAVVLGLISASFQLSQPQQSSALDNPSAMQTGAAAMGQQLGQVAAGMMNKNLNIQPTLLARPGYEYNITLTSDVVLPGPYQD